MAFRAAVGQQPGFVIGRVARIIIGLVARPAIRWGSRELAANVTLLTIRQHMCPGEGKRSRRMIKQ
jgi:hypothetical protein